jgi:hypothetical protein
LKIKDYNFNVNLILLLIIDSIFHLGSSTSPHFGQLVWAKLASAPFWPAVIFTEENQDWIRHKGENSPEKPESFLQNKFFF